MLFASYSARCARSVKACAWMPSALSRSKAIFTPIEIRHGLAKANGMPYVETALHRVKARLKSAHGSGRTANVCRTLPLALHVQRKRQLQTCVKKTRNKRPNHRKHRQLRICQNTD